MLPARERAQPADSSVHSLETAAVALAPDHSLVISRCDFASLQRQTAICIKYQLRVEEAPMIAFIHTEHHDDAMFPRGCADGCGDWTGDLYRSFVKPQVLRPHCDWRCDKRKVRVVRNCCFREYNKLSALRGGILNPREHPLDRAELRVQHRRELHGGRFDGPGSHTVHV